MRFGADMLKQRFDNPLFAQMIDQTIKDMPDDPQAFGAWRNQTKLETLDAKDQVPYFFEQVKTKELIGEGGDVGVLTTGGLKAPTIKTPRTLVPAPARTGTVNVEPSVPVDGGVGGPVSADDAERFIQSFPREAQAAIRQRINDGALGNIPMGSPVAPQSLVAGERGGVGGPTKLLTKVMLKRQRRSAPRTRRWHPTPDRRRFRFLGLLLKSAQKHKRQKVSN